MFHNSRMDSSSEVWDSDLVVEQLLKEYDESAMPIPDLDCQPHLLISKVRKHYMDYLIKLLSANYEKHQKLVNKNIYLPSAIWRCAKEFEIAATQSSMVAQLYRKNIVTVIKGLKNDTEKGKLNRKLYDCLRKPPENEKKIQVSVNTTKTCQCQCTCDLRKKRRKVSNSPTQPLNICPNLDLEKMELQDIQRIPVIENSQLHNNPQSFLIPKEISQVNGLKTQSSSDITTPGNNFSSPKQNVRMSIDSRDSDDLMLQLEKMFQGDDDDDIFGSALSNDESNKLLSDINDNQAMQKNDDNLDSNNIIENHSAKIKSLDERLEALAGILSQNDNTVAATAQNNNNVVAQKLEAARQRKHSTNKWLCEEYFLKVRFYELLDQMRDTNRNKFNRMKATLTELFGDDSDDDDVVSPLEETPEFITSCTERIAPWVVKLLTPHYIKGRIKGKALFKALAKHLIKLIYQCSRYPEEYEVHSFISDFLETHKLIRCEADFRQFRIENI